MASSRVETQIQWGGANTKSLSTTSWFISDAVSFNAEDWEAELQIRAENSGTPASGDTVEIRLLYTVGDLHNGAGADDYPDANTSGTTAALADPATVLDTYNNYDPDGTTVPPRTSAKGFKLAARAAQGATRAVTLAVRMVAHRPQ